MQILIKIYQVFNKAKHHLLIAFFGVSFTCKHRPTCSQYMSRQIEQNGIKGFFRGLRRILTCW